MLNSWEVRIAGWTGLHPGSNLLTSKANVASGYDNCKQWCNNNSGCGGFVVVASLGNCYFKSNQCKGTLITGSNPLYLKKEL